MIMYKPIHFAAHELVPPVVYNGRGDKSFQLIDDRLLIFIDYLRDHFGKVTINNWMWGGDRQWSGLRTSDSSYYRPYSQHSFGRACDCIFAEYTAEEVRQWLKNNVDVWQKATGVYSITVEEGVDWLHIDVRNNHKGYNSFYP